MMYPDARPHVAAPPGAPTSTADATRPRGGGRFRKRRRRTAGETRRRLPRGRAERRRETVDAILGKKKTSQRFSRPTPADEERKRDDDDDACAGSAARARAIHLLCVTDARTRERAAKEPRAFSRPAAVTAAPPRARLKARSAAAASASARADENARENGGLLVTKKTNSRKAFRVGGVPSSLALAQCAACGRRNYGVAVSKRDAVRGPASRRDGSWRSRDARATAGVLRKGARRVTVAKTFFTSTSASKKNHPSDEYLVPVVEFVPCVRCGDAWYCDRACVESDWPRHRKLCAGVRCSFAPRDGDLSAGDVDLGYARGERAGSEAFRNAFLETSVARGTKWG